MCTQEVTPNTAVSLLTKLLFLVQPLENNKTLNPGRAAEPYVPCRLVKEWLYCLLTKDAYIWELQPPATFLRHCVIIDGDYQVVVGRRRPQLIIRRQRELASFSVWICT